MLAIFKAAGRKIIKLKPLTRGREQAAAALDVAKILPLVPFNVLVKSADLLKQTGSHTEKYGDGTSGKISSAKSAA